METARAIIKATAATLTPCIGFVPTTLRVVNLTDRTQLVWTDTMLALANQRYGLAIGATGTAGTVNTAAAGVVVYAGGDKLSAASTQYLRLLEADQSDVDVSAGSPITTFDLDTAANYTGHFDADATGATIGPGSKITFDGKSKVYTITALTAGAGAAADEVTLDSSPGSGTLRVTKIWSMYDYTGAPSGTVCKAGFTIGASATVNNTDGDKLLIEATNA